MMFADMAYRGLLSLDRIFSRLQVRCHERRGCLVTLYFHSLFLDEAELHRDLAYPQQGTTVEHFRQAIACFLQAGYTFISPAELLGGLDTSKRYALLTFDDGYFNNRRAVPALEEYDVPALFFVSAWHVKQGKAFWWDVIYRARRARGSTFQQVVREFHGLGRQTTEAIEDRIVNEWGREALTCRDDVDRPFTPAELREFARSKHVFIGNHTCNHAVLEAYPGNRVRVEISNAQVLLEEMSGQRPLAIAYPNGSWNAGVVRTARECGLSLGFTTEPRKEYLPEALQCDRRFSLGRFAPWGNDALLKQCEYFRSDLMLAQRYQRLKNSAKALVSQPARDGSSCMDAPGG